MQLVVNTEIQAVQGAASTPTGAYIDVRDRGARSGDEEMQLVVNTEIQAVQEAASTPMGAYIDVRDRGARSGDEEMRRIYVFTY